MFVDSYYWLGDAQSFFGVLVTILVLCILSDESNFLLRIIVAILRKSLCNQYIDLIKDSSDESTKPNLSSSSIRFRGLMLDKEYSGRFFSLLAKEFHIVLEATIYVLLYAIAILCLDEFHSNIFKDDKGFFAMTLTIFTAASSVYWIILWLIFCFRFKNSFVNIANEIRNDMDSMDAFSKYKPRINYKDWGFVRFLCIFVSILIVSWLIPCEFGSLRISDDCLLLIRHFSISFIILNGFAIPILLVILNSHIIIRFPAVVSSIKKKANHLMNTLSCEATKAGMTLQFYLLFHFLSFMILAIFFVLGCYQ